MPLTEAQIEEAQKELRRREKERSDAYSREYARRQAEADAAFETRMDDAYPGIDSETRWSIYYDYRDYQE